LSRGFRLSAGRAQSAALSDDLLTDRNARIFLSNQTLPLAARRLDQGNISARLYPLMHDTVPLDTPNFTTASVREKFLPSFRRAASLSSAIICNSRHTRDRVSHWCRELGVGNTPACSIDSSSDLVEQTARDTPVHALVGKRFIIYCSTIEPRKNHLLALKVLKGKVESGVGDMPVMVFCGRRGWSYAEVFNFLRDNPRIKPFVLFLQGISDSELIWLYRNALFSIFPSFEEGWGLAASESLDFGTPVVISQAPALREATQGLMPAIDAADIPAWSAKIDELAASPQALGELRERISKHYKRTRVEETFRQIVECMSR
jgi:glycosyltransferase involved in cell wall biosynthesis